MLLMLHILRPVCWLGHTGSQWCIAKNGGGYTPRGVAKGLKVPCLFMITEVSIRCQKNPEVSIRRIPAYTPPPNTPLLVALQKADKPIKGSFEAWAQKHVLKGVNIVASLRIRSIYLCGGGDACCRCHYSANSLALLGTY